MSTDLALIAYRVVDEQRRATRIDAVPQVGDAEWVANLLDTCRAGDIDLAVENLEWLLGRLKRASKARRSLARIPARQLRAGLAVGSRSESGS